MQPDRVHYLKCECVNQTGGIRQEMLHQKGFTKGLKNKAYIYYVTATEYNTVSNVFRTILVVFSETTSINIRRRGNLTWYKQII